MLRYSASITPAMPEQMAQSRSMSPLSPRAVHKAGIHRLRHLPERKGCGVCRQAVAAVQALPGLHHSRLFQPRQHPTDAGGVGADVLRQRSLLRERPLWLRQTSAWTARLKELSTIILLHKLVGPVDDASEVVDTLIPSASSFGGILLRRPLRQ